MATSHSQKKNKSRVRSKKTVDYLSSVTRGIKTVGRLLLNRSCSSHVALNETIFKYVATVRNVPSEQKPVSLLDTQS